MRTSHRGINAIQTGAGACTISWEIRQNQCHVIVKLRKHSDVAVAGLIFLYLARIQALDLDGPDQNSTHDGLGRNKVEPDVAFWKVHTPTVIAHESGDVQFRKIVTLVRRHDSSL